MFLAIRLLFEDVFCGGVMMLGFMTRCVVSGSFNINDDWL